MARIPDNQIEQIKRDASLLDLVRQQGCKVSKQGKDHVVNCPFHEDKTPSCVISPKNNLFNCFGCGTGGSVIDWVMKTQGLAFREAVVWLSNDVLPLNEPPTITEKPANLPPLAADLITEKDKQDLLHKVINYYRATLKQSPEAQAYLKTRGLDDPELIDTFKLGYANRTLSLKLLDKTSKEGALIRRQLMQIGIYRESGHEHFNGSLVVPVIDDEQGNITEVYGRKTVDKLRKGTPKHLYLPGAHQGIFNVNCLVAEEVILCESLIDALTFWRHGFKNVTTSYGTQGFTDELLEGFKQGEVKRVLIAYDRDECCGLMNLYTKTG